MSSIVIDDALAHAIQLIKAGRQAEAQFVLEPYIEANPHDIRAWMWQAEIFQEDRDKVKVLESCLAQNPGHPQVSQALKFLRTRAGLPDPIEPEILTSTPVPTSPERSEVRRPNQGSKSRPPAHKSSPGRVIKRKHPGWPTVDGIVDYAEIHVLRVNRIPTYYSKIEAMYVVQGRDYRVKFKYATKTSLTSIDAEILTSTYAPGTGIIVSYDPRHPGRAWVDEWDPRMVRQKLKDFKDKPEIRAEICRRHRSRMMTGLWITLGSIAATVLVFMFLPGLGPVGFFFSAAIVIGLFYFITGLVGWLWNMD